MFDIYPLSSSVDWCEDNYVMSRYIAEYINSWSSLFISCVGIYGMYYYANVSMLYFMLIVVGVSSFMFHATLSEFNQMFDELSIMLTIIVSLIYMNDKIRRVMPSRYALLLGLFMFLTTLCVPQYNRFIMFSWSVIIIWYIRTYYNEINEVSTKYIQLGQIYFVLAVICWILDYMCILFLYNFYLHGCWHILVGLCGYNVFKGISYMACLP